MNFDGMFGVGRVYKMMIRKHFRITKRQDLLIKRIAKRHGVSEAEIIRRAIERETSREPIIETPEANSVLAERKEPLDTSLE